jgi:hypothetical protein
MNQQALDFFPDRHDECPDPEWTESKGAKSAVSDEPSLLRVEQAHGGETHKNHVVINGGQVRILTCILIIVDD